MCRPFPGNQQYASHVLNSLRDQLEDQCCYRLPFLRCGDIPEFFEQRLFRRPRADFAGEMVPDLNRPGLDLLVGHSILSAFLDGILEACAPCVPVFHEIHL